MQRGEPDTEPAPGRRRVFAGVLFAGLVTALTPACLYDPDERCDAHQQLGPSESCVCEEGFVFRGQACLPCGENELYESGACVCEEGFTRSGDEQSRCVESGAGTACDPDESAPCQDPDFPVCRDRGEGVGYCTAPCAGDDECPHGYVCDTEADPATCKSSAVGQGDACASDDDCEGKDATYCEVTVAHACLVQGCSMDSPLSCSEGFACCDLEPLGVTLTLCIPEGMCPTAP